MPLALRDQTGPFDRLPPRGINPIEPKGFGSHYHQVVY